MANLRQSARVNMDGWEPAPEKPAKIGIPSTDADTNNKSPLMLASMPLGASTNDALQRQFYGGANVPLFRILPAKQGGGM